MELFYRLSIENSVRRDTFLYVSFLENLPSRVGDESLLDSSRNRDSDSLSGFQPDVRQQSNAKQSKLKEDDEDVFRVKCSSFGIRHTSSLSDTPFVGLTRTTLLSSLQSDDETCEDVVVQSVPKKCDDLFQRVPREYRASFWDEIVEISYVRDDIFYDLTVPGFEHYSAQGLWHHNSGKSKPLLIEAFMHGLEFPGSESIILRKTIPDLKRTVISKFLSDIPRSLYQRYNETDHIVYFHPVPEKDARGRLTGKMLQSKLYFAACERDEDVGKYLSTEYVFIGFEELGEFSFGVWDAMCGRNRCPIPGSRSCMAAATNPMGVGWSWIKKLWVDHKPFKGMDAEKYNAKDYEYIHSTVDDNPIYSKDKEYVAALERSPNRERIRYGKLDAVSGQYFDNWEPARHVRKREDFIFQKWQTYVLGWDYGFGHYAVMVWLTKALLKPRWEGEKPKIVNVFTRELYLHENTPKQQAEAVISAIPRLQKDGEDAGYAETVESVHLSWERFNRTVSDYTVAQEIGDLLAAAGLPRPVSSNRVERVAGWMKMYQLFDTDELFVLDDCETIIESIPQLVRHETKLEDVKKPKGLSLTDDVGDACLAGDTLITTRRGLVPIREVTTNDQVLTRRGYRRVLWSGQTGVHPIMQVAGLKVTGNHPVLVDDRFVIASNIQSGWLTVHKSSYLKARSIAAIRPADTCICGNTSADEKTVGILSFILKSIEAAKARFQKGITYITKAGTRSTIASRILNYFRQVVIGNFIGYFSPKSVRVVEASSSPAGIEVIPTGFIAPHAARTRSYPANSAADSPEEKMETQGIDVSVPISANLHGGESLESMTFVGRVHFAVRRLWSIVTRRPFTVRVRVHQKTVQEDGPSEPVYNLSVEHDEEYFANGILVHNCRYAIAGALCDPDDKPEEEKFRERVKDMSPLRRHIEQFREYNERQAKERGPQKEVIIPSWRRRVQ